MNCSAVSPDIILNTVIWSDDSNLFVMWMNRVQNESSLVHYFVEDTVESKNVSILCDIQIFKYNYSKYKRGFNDLN